MRDPRPRRPGRSARSGTATAARAHRSIGRREGARARAAALLVGASCAGCAGGGPLLHPAHVLRPGVVTIGGGVSGRLAVAPVASSSSGGTQGEAAQRLTTSPGVAPWIGARVGLRGSNEAGLAYTGRAVRLDARHALSLGAPTLSFGGGASFLIAERPKRDGRGVYGGGFDVPVLLGLASRSDLYALWLGPRAGIEWMSGHTTLTQAAGAATAEPGEDDGAGAGLVDASARHVHAGGLAGLRVGFRHVFAAVEVDVSYHRGDATLGGSTLALNQVAVTPAGALVFSF